MSTCGRSRGSSRAVDAPRARATASAARSAPPARRRRRSMSGTCSASLSARRRRGRAAAAARWRAGRRTRSHRVAVGRRGGAVHEARRDELHARAAARQRAGQRVVVGRHVCRGIDELNAHPADILRPLGSRAHGPSRRPRGLRAARGCDDRGLLRHAAAQERVPARDPLRAPSRSSSRPTATATGTRPGWASTCRSPPRSRFSIMDGEGNEVRRLVDDRQLAGRRQAPLPLGRPRRRRGARARRRLPHARGPPRRGPRDRLGQARSASTPSRRAWRSCRPSRA